VAIYSKYRIVKSFTKKKKEINMQVIGALLVIWGIADFALSWNEIDLYYEIGINVPADIYPFTAWIAIFIGGVIYRLGSKK
jgi:hypothetical protein